MRYETRVIEMNITIVYVNGDTEDFTGDYATCDNGVEIRYVPPDGKPMWIDIFIPYRRIHKIKAYPSRR